MRTKELGQTGVMLPEIGLGTWRYKADDKPIRRGVELGAFLIDTAEYYGNEGLVGGAIKGIRDQVLLATKVSADHFQRKDLLAAVDRSLQCLAADYIDLYQLHWPNQSVPIEETMGAMEAAADAGKVRFIGVSNFSLPELKAAQAVMTKHKIVSNQMRYSLVDRNVEVDLLPYCQAQGITLIAYSPLAQGVSNLTSHDPEGVLDELARLTGKTTAQIALNWCVSKQAVVAIPKASSVQRVEENCGASGWSLSAEQLHLLESRVRFERRGRWETGLRRGLGRLLGKIRSG